MPATATRSRSARILVPIVLFVGVAALGLGPLGCIDEASNDPAAEQNEQTTDRSILLNVGIEDETDERPISEQFLVESPKSERWRVGVLTGSFVTKAFEKYPVGSTYELLLYPEGEDGPRLVVPFSMKSTMSSALASSRTNIAVYDDSIVVEGPAVPDKRMTFERPAASDTP